MGKSSRRETGKKLSGGRSTIQVVLPSSPSIPSPTKKRFHIDWKQVNFVQFVAVFSCFLFLTLFAIIPVLNEFSLLRPHTNALAQILSSAFLAFATILSVGFIYFQKVKIWQSFNSKQIIFDAVISIFAVFVLIASIVQFPSSSSSFHPNLSRIPYPPYRQGTLVLDGMPNKPSSKYYWVQRTDSQASCKFVGSDYYVSTTKHDSVAWCELVNSDFHNFAFEIDMSFLKPGIASILFQLTNQASYELDIQSIGNGAELSLGVLSGFEEGKLNYRGLIQPMPIVARDEGPLVFSSGNTNRIAVVVIDQTMNIYVNGLTTKDWQRTDDSSSHGSIVVTAFTSSHQQGFPTEVIFSNARAWTF